MIRRRRVEGSDASDAAVAGGVVTREKLRRCAAASARDGSPLISSLLAQGLPAESELSRLFPHPLRLDVSLLVASPRATRLLDPDRLREWRCIPLELLDDVCILAVEPGRAHDAVQRVRAEIRRDVVPVLVEPEVLDGLLARLPPATPAVRRSEPPRPESAVQGRFRELVLERTPLDALRRLPGEIR